MRRGFGRYAAATGPRRHQLGHLHDGEEQGPDPGRPAELGDVGRLARRGLATLVRVARADEEPDLEDLLRDHLGEVADQVEPVQEQWAPYESVNVQRAIDAWLDVNAVRHRVVGVQTGGMEVDLAGLLDGDLDMFGAGMTRVSRIRLPSGPDGATLSCIRCAIHLVEDRDGPLVLFVRLAESEPGRSLTIVEIAAADRDRASAVADELRRLGQELNVYRGHVLSFGSDMFGFGPGSSLTFQPRPRIERHSVVLDEDVLAGIERQVLGIARHREALAASGQHLKRGLLLFGPPGVGKTHTIRYLAGTMTTTTFVLVAGEALEAVGAASSLARALQPAVVVVEDVDLIAEDRGTDPRTQPLLFELLNEMDGLAGDSDVAFVLTTNRADLLEPALAQRPGRIDQAVELSLPDLDARRRLFGLYGGGLRIRATDAEIDAVLEDAEGVTASFLKELLRRAALLAAEREAPQGRPASEDRDDGPTAAAPPALTVTATDLQGALEDLLHSRNRLTRVLLGATPPAGEGRADGPG